MSSTKSKKRIKIDHEGNFYLVDHETETVSVPTNVEKESFPEYIKKYIDKFKYLVQLTIQ